MLSETQVWHAHPSQIQAYEEMGFAKQEILMTNGKMPGFDGLTANVGQFTIAGREVVHNIHADQTRIDFMEFGSWLKVVWGKAPFWFKNRSGQWVFQIYDPASGNPTANEGCYYVDARQYAVDRPPGYLFGDRPEGSCLQLTPDEWAGQPSQPLFFYGDHPMSYHGPCPGGTVNHPDPHFKMEAVVGATSTPNF